MLDCNQRQNKYLLRSSALGLPPVAQLLRLPAWHTHHPQQSLKGSTVRPTAIWTLRKFWASGTVTFAPTVCGVVQHS